MASCFLGVSRELTREALATFKAAACAEDLLQPVSRDEFLARQRSVVACWDDRFISKSTFAVLELLAELGFANSFNCAASNATDSAATLERGGVLNSVLRREAFAGRA